MTNLLITGGTGSFGRAFARHALDAGCRRLVVFSRDEQKQEVMANDINDGRLRFFIGDVRDPDRLGLALRGIDTVVHAAALKIVPACEYNPTECIATNVHGTENVIRASLLAGVRRLIGLSTDKAVNPTNLYGATKLCAEKLLVAANALSGYEGCRFAVVRYGNVMGSRGSVVPLFRSLAAAGRPLPITDPRMTRFWMTLPQAVELVSVALNLMCGGEIFVPKLPALRIVDLAAAMAPNNVTSLIGIRPGEKLHETLISSHEAARTRDCGSYFVIGGQVGDPVPDDFEFTSQSTFPVNDIQSMLAAA